MSYEPFYCPDGSKIHNVAQLYRFIKKLDEAWFKYYVNSEKNDFSNWLDYIGEKDAAAKLKNALTKEQALIVLAGIRYHNNNHIIKNDNVDNNIKKSDIQNNPLISGSLNDKVKWYIRAHGHSSIGGLNLIYTYFDFYQKKEEAAAVQKAIYLFEKFSEGDLKQQLKNLRSAMQKVRNMVEISDMSKPKKKEMGSILDGVDKNISRIDLIIKNPQYEEKFKPNNILFSAVVQLTSQYPNTLYGDLIGDKGADKGDRIKLTVEEQADEKEILCCGYEMQLLFLNLLCNAVDAIIEKGNIYVKLKYTNNNFCVDISDDGKLLSDEDIKKIMEHKEFSTKGNEHGRGLKIVSDVLGKYKGSLDIKKDASAERMTFSIKIPLKN